jgi:hypothetical protein
MTTPCGLGWTSGEVFPHQPPSLRWGRSSDGGTVAWWLGARGTASRPLRPTPPPWLEWSSSGPGAGAGARRRAIPPLRRCSRGATAVGGAARPQCFAQPSAERGAADPRRPRVACLPGASASSGQIAAFFFDLVVFVFVFSVWHSWVSSADGRSSSSAPATGTTPSTR